MLSFVASIAQLFNRISVIVVTLIFCFGFFLTFGLVVDSHMRSVPSLN